MPPSKGIFVAEDSGADPRYTFCVAPSFILYQIDNCARCGGPRIVPGFSKPAATPQCLTCTGYEDWVEPMEPSPSFEGWETEAVPREASLSSPPRSVEDLIGGMYDPKQILELSAQVGSFQMAVLNQEGSAAEAFLRNIMRIAETLLGK